MKHNNEINHLLGKYLSGESTLSEESQIREYFLNTPETEIDPEVRKFKPLFEYIAEEAEKIDSKKQSGKRIPRNFLLSPRTFTWGMSAAALLVAGMFLFSPQQKNKFEFRVDGKRVHDRTQAINFASERLGKVNEMITSTGKYNRIVKIMDKTESALNPLERMNKTLSQNKG